MLNVIPHEKALTFMLSGKAEFCLWNKKTDNRENYYIHGLFPDIWNTYTEIFNNVKMNVHANHKWIIYGAKHKFLGNLYLVALEHNVKHLRYYPNNEMLETLSGKGFIWYLHKLTRPSKTTIPDYFTLYHFGKCGVCGRKLKDPESIECGIGPICRSKTN